MLRPRWSPLLWLSFLTLCQAHRVLMLALSATREWCSDDHIAAHQRILTAHMREDLRDQTDEQGRNVFVDGLRHGSIEFSLLGDASDFHLPHKHTLIHTDDDPPLFR